MLPYEGSGTGEVPGRDKGFQIAGTVHDITCGYRVIPPEGRETGLRDALGRLAGVESSSAFLTASYAFGALREATVNLGRRRVLN